MKFQFRQSYVFGALLHLLLPGLGHVYWREYLFGLFIFLIMLLATALYFVSFLFKLPAFAYWVLFSLPIVFYVFAFVDLARAIRRQRDKVSLSRHRWLVCLAVGLVYVAVSPSSPIDFARRNLPSIDRMTTSDFSPALSRGDLVKSSRLAYSVELFFLDQPMYHHLPERFDIIRFTDERANQHYGVVIGLPGEEIEVLDGVVAVNGYPQIEPAGFPIVLSGDCPLTFTHQYNILVATLYLGKIDSVYEVSFRDIYGKVSRLL